MAEPGMEFQLIAGLGFAIFLLMNTALTFLMVTVVLLLTK